VKRYHLYHHSPRGIDLGYGITSGFWDWIFKTSYPPAIRRSLLGSRGQEMRDARKQEA
jgi:sterol desaturase/sphingolipid hydroxylase (fatty acid hydroxylase superfamily)